ncbi:MAG: universal stress protein [Halodesulfurarchaeum sp.]|nr:universal stress protein [Halodesulfurarchaeum sp.]
MHDNILITSDGSDRAEQGVKYGLKLAEETGAKVHALYVVETKAAYILTVGISDDEMTEHEAYGEDVVTEIVESAADRDLEAVGVVKKGKPAEEIVEYARNKDIDMIIMGKQGHGAVEKYIGSTSEKVMRMAGIPVTIVGRSPV